MLPGSSPPAGKDGSDGWLPSRTELRLYVEYETIRLSFLIPVVPSCHIQLRTQKHLFGTESKPHMNSMSSDSSPPLVAIILAGGTGTRLYPASRSHRPKQFLDLFETGPLLEQTIDRCGFADEIVISTSPKYRDQISADYPEVEVLTEPVAKDTGPALIHATKEVAERYGDCLVCGLPSDHLIGQGFERTARRAASVAGSAGGLVTIGIEPTRPATEYGYIEPGPSRDGYHRIESFHEKPAIDRARSYLDDGYFWNAGIFVWRPDALLREVRKSPLAPFLDRLETEGADAAFDAVDPVSIDHGVMESADERYVVPAAFSWDDVGSWSAIGRHLPTDSAGNAVRGSAITVDAADNTIVSDDGTISVIGASDLVVVKWDDHVLVVPKDQDQRVRDVVDRLRENDEF